MPQKTKFRLYDVVVVANSPKYLKGVNRLGVGTIGWVTEIGHRDVGCTCCLEIDSDPFQYRFGFSDLEYLDHIEPEAGEKIDVAVPMSRVCSCGDSIPEGYNNPRCRRCQAVADNLRDEERSTRDIFKQLQVV